MVVDTSALCAILFNEPERHSFLERLSEPDRHVMSSMTYFESAMVVESAQGPAGSKKLSDLLKVLEVDIVAFDSGMAEMALDAWRRFGKGRHRAALNFGDCAAYALAKLTQQPLLYKGNDFSKTDLPANAL